MVRMVRNLLKFLSRLSVGVLRVLLRVFLRVFLRVLPRFLKVLLKGFLKVFSSFGPYLSPKPLFSTRPNSETAPPPTVPRIDYVKPSEGLKGLRGKRQVKVDRYD